MTNTSHGPPLAYTDLVGAITALRRRGLRLSTTRRLILEALFAADGPISAEHITRRLTLHVTTVYRNLETLENHGVVRHVHLGHGPGLYALLAPGEREYLYCEHCGAVRALPREQLDSFRTASANDSDTKCPSATSRSSEPAQRAQRNTRSNRPPLHQTRESRRWRTSRWNTITTPMATDTPTATAPGCIATRTTTG